MHRRLLPIIKKIRVFRNFTPKEVEFIVTISDYKSLQSGEMIYKEGAESDEMLILLQGKLRVTSNSGSILGEIVPGTSTGEMGVLTGQPRTANVLASEKSSGLVISRAKLSALFSENQSLEVKALRNIVELLCERLGNVDKQLSEKIEGSKLSKKETEFVYTLEGSLG